MRNVDKIRQMSAEELGAFLGKAINQCSLCNYRSRNCEKGITRWLNAKIEKPMPEIDIGDIVDTPSYIYVSIGSGLLVRPSQGLRVWVSDIEDDITTIQKFNVDHYEVVWRADNEN